MLIFRSYDGCRVVQVHGRFADGPVPSLKQVDQEHM